MRQILFYLMLFFLVSFGGARRPFVPPGTVQLNTNFFMDATEISNFSWLEYEMDIRKRYGKDSPEHLSVMPDNNVWEDVGSLMEPYKKHYYQHPAYRNYPVVGVSYEQALNYCKWRSRRVNQLLYIRSHNGVSIETVESVDSIPQVVCYRLPTEHEWKLAAGFPISESNQRRKQKNCKECPAGNFFRKSSTEVESVGPTDVTAPVQSYWPNEKGLFNLFGNVSEMISEKGIAKGGSWMDEEGTIDILSLQKYTKPGPWLGFRCVAILNHDHTN